MIKGAGPQPATGYGLVDNEPMKGFVHDDYSICQFTLRRPGSDAPARTFAVQTLLAADENFVQDKIAYELRRTLRVESGGGGLTRCGNG